ncbi:hypothetical protein BLOT_010207 [Blomia tropicalis]|nr:hypothetical protein BLOT_010207 [Blomia tropicalis]
MSRSPFFRPGMTGDPFWDMFASERFFDSHFGANLTEDDFFPMVPSYFVRRRTVNNAPRSPQLMAHSPGIHGSASAHPLGAMPSGGLTQPGPNPTGGAPGTGTAAAAVAASAAPGGGQLMTPTADASKYQIMVDVSHFTPEEITVKTIDNTIVVVGKHEDKADNYGYVSRQFSRKYLLPADVDPETVTSTMSADGILSIQAPRKPLQIKESDGRPIPIAFTNQCISPGVNMAAPQFPSQVQASGQQQQGGGQAPVPPTTMPQIPINVEQVAPNQAQQQAQPPPPPPPSQ